MRELIIKFACMEPEEGKSGPVKVMLRDPGKVLGYIWWTIGSLLLLAFLLPNYTIASLEITGPKLIKDFLRQDTNPRRMLDDAGFFMMVAVPVVNLALALASFIAGTLSWRRAKSANGIWFGIFGLAALTFSIIGVFVIGNTGGEVPFFSKLMPKPAMGYWLAMILQALLCCVAGADRFLLMRR